MFKLADPDKAYPQPVKVQVPTEEGLQTQTFTAHFKPLPLAAIQKLLEAQDDVLFLKAVLGGFEGIQDHEGTALKCTDKTLENLSQIGYFTHAVVDAYLGFARGIATKN